MKEPCSNNKTLASWSQKIVLPLQPFFNKGNVASEITSGDFCFIGCDAIRILYGIAVVGHFFLGGLVAFLGRGGVFPSGGFLGGLGFFLWTSEYGYF